MPLALKTAATAQKSTKRGASAKKRRASAPLMQVREAYRSLLSAASAGLAGAAALIAWLKRYPAVIVMVLGWIAVLVVWSYRNDLMERFFDHPVATVQVKGQLNYLDEAQLTAQLNGILGQGFFSLDLYQLKAEIEQNGWVEKASIRRVWPDTLEYLIVEQVAVANWNDAHLLNPYGDRFQPGDGDRIEALKAALPRLRGEAGEAQQVLRQYAELSGRMTSGGITLSELALDARGDWTLVTDHAVTIRLGSTDIPQRLDRAMRVYQQLAPRGIELVAVLDARYTNGVSVTWRTPEGAAAQKARMVAIVPE